MKTTSNRPVPVAQQSRECSPAGPGPHHKIQDVPDGEYMTAGQIKKRNGGPALCGAPGSSGDIFHEKKQYTDADWISTPHRGNPDCRLYTEHHQYFPAVRRNRSFVLNPLRNGRPAGSRHGTFGYATNERTGKWHRSVRDTAGRDDEGYSTLRNHAVRHASGWNNEWHGTLRRLSAIRIDAFRHPTGITVKEKNARPWQADPGFFYPLLSLLPVILPGRAGGDRQ